MYICKPKRSMYSEVPLHVCMMLILLLTWTSNGQPWPQLPPIGCFSTEKEDLLFLQEENLLLLEERDLLLLEEKDLPLPGQADHLLAGEEDLKMFFHKKNMFFFFFQKKKIIFFYRRRCPKLTCPKS